VGNDSSFEGNLHLVQASGSLQAKALGHLKE
jgi:hypothetical protein